MPNPRWFHASALGGDGKIYVYGGYVYDSDGLRQYGVKEYSLAIYDPKADAWTRGPEVPPYRNRGRKRFARGRIDENGNVYQEFHEKELIGEQRAVHELITGSSGALGRPHWLNHYAWIWFDVEKGEWSYPAVLPLWVENLDFDREKSPKGPSLMSEGGPLYFRYSGTLATDGGQLIYISGGNGRPVDEPLARSVVLNALESYDVRTNQWKLLAPMHQPRDLHAAAVDREGRLFVFGGHEAPGVTKRAEGESDESFKRRSAENSRKASTSLVSVEMYDPKTNRWTDRAPLPTPRQEMGAALGADGRIYVVGGSTSYSNPTPLAVVEIYDPATDSWETSPPLKHPRRAHQVVGTPEGRIYAIGGSVARRTPRWFFESPNTVPKLGASVEVLETAPASR
jgi:N-acetylneuraminic acid mutarotase